MTVVRSLLFASIFYPATVLWVLTGVVASFFGRAPTLKVVLSWCDFHHWLTSNLLGIDTRVDGLLPRGAYLFAVKHESMYETLEMVRLTHLPVIVMKKELADIPLFGFLTNRRSRSAGCARRMATRRCSTASSWLWRRARSTRCSVPTVPARPRWCVS